MGPHATVHKFSGPPGTGKSTTLLNVVEALLDKKTDPEHIVYTSFTRTAAYEARDRACARFNVPQSRFPYFKTLHALCYGMLPSCDVMTGTDWCQLAKQLNLSFSLSYRIGGQQDPEGNKKGDALMSIWNVGRVRMLPYSRIFNSCQDPGSPYIITEQEFDHFVSSVVGYKREFGKLDFTDMLEHWLQHGQFIHADYIIVDEAQDLSALQWAVIRKLCTHAKRVWVAGDDDQCIHEWNGADPRQFIELPSDHYQVLPQSHRIPAKVHAVAESIISKVTRRLPKTYLPRIEAGTVHRVAQLESLDLRSGSWLLLARNSCYLGEFISLCHQRGLLFTGAGNTAIQAKILRVIRTWKQIQQGKSVAQEEAVAMYAFMSQRDRVKRGLKMVLQAAKVATVNYASLVADYGLCIPQSMPWNEALDMIPEEISRYFQTVERVGNLDDTPRIHISTIHGAKGMEADNVVVRPDITKRTHETYISDPESEHRVFYVAVTRARQTLFLMLPTSELAYPV